MKPNFIKPAALSITLGFFLGVIVPLDLPIINLAATSKLDPEFYQKIQGTIGESLNAKLTPITQKLELDKKRQQAIIFKQQKMKAGWIPTQFQGKIFDSVSLKPATNKKIVALTFDDGPAPEYTNDILYILRRYNIKATFFIIGQNAQNYAGRLKQIANDGHALGNHSWNHSYRYQTPQQAAQQIENTTKIIYQITGIKTTLFRPPGGLLNTGLVSYAQRQKYGIVMWSADSQDYRSSKETLLKNLLQKTENGGILLMHDGGGDRWQTLVALPYLIDELQRRNYQFVTVPELLMMANH